MNILLTGGAGFIGSHTVERLLERGESVTVLDDFNDFYNPALKRRNAAAFAARVRLVEADICDADALRLVFHAGRFDAVVHLAARAGVRPSIRQPLLYTRVNIGGTHNLLELAREFGVKKFVFASSSSVYGINQKVPFAEGDPIFQPISPYAATKLAGEALGHVYHHLHGLDVVCLRFFTVYGPRQRPDLAIRKFTEAIAAGQPIEMYGDGATRRDYTHIDDILQGVLAALDRPFGCEVINLGESRTVELRELVRLIEKELGRSATIQSLPTQPGDVPLTYADITKARRLLGYKPQVPIEEGIRRFVAWFKSQT
ncbi:MAG: NAD-dependent epimerase/dehydratase family protein [Verrucomicrobia bacterium]|nr:NAD-dependent epimerase/dehydratase family protein [Verrucomicrobiota bacterium]